jgi:hypothetical protein
MEMMIFLKKQIAQYIKNIGGMARFKIFLTR